MKNDFYSVYDLSSADTVHRSLTVMYFAFTTLSTVGFGDLYPQSNSERLVMAFAFIAGISLFSLVMGNFLEAYILYTTIDDENNDDERLAKFFGLMAHFNLSKFPDK